MADTLRGWLAFVLCAAALALMFTVSARSHDHWINHNRLVDPITKEHCCNENDCERVGAGGVIEQGASYLIVATGEAFPSARVIWKSADGRWWRCRYIGGEQQGRTRCLIGTPPGM